MAVPTPFPASTVHAVVGVVWAFAAVAVCVLILRLWVRIKVNRALTSDDWLMGAALISQLVYTGLMTGSCLQALVPPPPGFPFNVDMVKYAMISMPFATFASVVGRISACILLIRIFGTKAWFKWYLIAITAALTITSILAVVFGLARVSPVEGIWDASKIKFIRWPIQWHVITAGITAGLWALSDLTYVVFPTFIIWNLNMNTKRRVGLCLLLASSLFTMAAAIIKACATLILGPANPFKFYEALMWAAIEQNFVIIMGCVPALIPFSRIDSSFVRWVNSLVSSRSSQRRSPSIIPEHSGGGLSIRGNNAAYQAMNAEGSPALRAKKSGTVQVEETSLTMDEARYNVRSGSAKSNENSDLEIGAVTSDSEEQHQHGQLSKS